MRVLSTALMAAGVLVAASVGLAPAASAAEVELDLCGGVSVAGQSGDHLMYIANPGCTPIDAWPSGGGGTGPWEYYTLPEVWGISLTSSAGWTYGYGAESTCAAAFFGPDADRVAMADSALSNTGLPICPFSVASDPETPQMLEYEAVGKHGNCDVAGGWTESWQEWVNAGAGGPVCQRVLLYSDGTWVVGMWSPSANKFVPNRDAAR